MLAPPKRRSPSVFPADEPSSWIGGEPAKPGWVVASMITGPVMSGRALSGWIVWGPVPIKKVMVSSPGWRWR